jgi:membrane dipeptidase
MDMLWEEAEESSDTMTICLNSKDIDTALGEGKIALLLQMEGGRPLEGKPTLNTLVGLRTFYRQGLRVLQLVDNGRNRIGDGKGESRTKGGLTNFGISVVKEMNRLGMLIDVAHLSEPGFWDVIETSKDPIIDSHSNARAVCDHIRNLTDEQIKAIAKKGGVIGLSCFAALISQEPAKATMNDLMKHVDHIAGLVGIDHVGFGPDFNGFEKEVIDDIWAAPGSGWLEGVFYGPGPHRMEGVDSITAFPLFTEALVKRGYSDEDIKKVLGENFLRVFRQVIR